MRVVVLRQVLRHKSGADDFDFAGPDPDKPRRISAKYQLTRRLPRKLSDPGISPCQSKASNAKRAALVTYYSTSSSLCRLALPEISQIAHLRPCDMAHVSVNNRYVNHARGLSNCIQNILISGLLSVPVWENASSLHIRANLANSKSRSIQSENDFYRASDFWSSDKPKNNKAHNGSFVAFYERLLNLHENATCRLLKSGTDVVETTKRKF